MNSHNIKQILLVFLITMFLGVQTFAATQTSVDATGNIIQQAPVLVPPVTVEDPNSIPVSPAPVEDPNSIPVSPAPVEDPNSIPVTPAPVEDPNNVRVPPLIVED